MANYKPGGHIVLESNGIQTPINVTADIKHLYDRVNLATTADTFLDSVTGLAYEVPDGRQFKIYSITIDTIAIAGSFALWEGISEDALTNLLATLKTPTYVGRYTWYLDSITALTPDQEFITYKPSAASVQYVEITGYEFAG